MRVQGTNAIVLNASSGNVLSGKQLEIPENHVAVKAWAAASAVGMVASMQAGSETLLEESAVSQANRFPVEPDDRLVQDVVFKGKRLSLNFRNTTGGTITVYWAVETQAVG